MFCASPTATITWASSLRRLPQRRAVRALFGEHDGEDLERFLDATVGPLIRWDRSRSADLARTLLTYLDAGQSTAEASKALHIHPNTLRQRLERVAAVLPAWRDPSRILEIHMALRLAALREEVQDR